MTHRRFFAALFSLVILLAGASQLLASRSGRGGGGDDGGGGGHGSGSLVLRVNPAEGVPGGIVAVVVRTYAPRPVRQGQVMVRVVRRPKPAKLGLSVEELTQPLRPFLRLISATVYSQQNDSSSQAALRGQPESQTATVTFQSPTSSINAADGPLAVLRFRLDPSLQPGQTFDLSVDPAATGLTDEQGQPITVAPRAGVLTIKAPR